jgi:hypothetical protein
MDNEQTFAAELEAILNKHSMENASNTPDFILAHYLLACLLAWNTGLQQRESWYGRDHRLVSSIPVNEPPSVT